MLRAEYLRKNGKPPASDNDLYNLDPDPRLDWTPAKSTIEVLKTFWTLTKQNRLRAGSIEAFNGALESFNDFLRKTGQKDLLGLFQVLKDLRTAFETKYKKVTTRTAEPRWQVLPLGVDDYTRALLYGLYGIACVQVWAAARVGKLFEGNRVGFKADEIAFLMKPIEQDSFIYRSNIRHALSGSMKNIREPFEEIRGFLNTYSLAKNNLSSNLDLVALDETMRIQAIWKRVRELLSLIQLAAQRNDTGRLRDIVASHPGAMQDLRDITSAVYKTKNQAYLGKATLAVGSVAGSHAQYGDLTIVYIDPKYGTIYVELATLHPQLFKATANYIDDAYYRGQILEIYKATAGIITISAFIFAAMGFMPVLIEVGFAGLIYEILVAFASEKIGDEVGKINPTLGEFVTLALQIAAPRPHFGPKVKAAAAERADQTGLSDVYAGKDASLVENRGTAETAASRKEARGTRGAANENLSESGAGATAAGPSPRTQKAGTPATDRTGSHSESDALIDEAVAEVAQLKEQERIAEEMYDRLAEKHQEAEASAKQAASGGGGAKRGKVVTNAAPGGSQRAVGGGRGTGNNGVARKIELIAALKLKLGRLARFLEDTAKIYREEMAKLKWMRNEREQSRLAHEATKKRLLADPVHSKNIVRGKQVTGITDAHVRESDVWYYDPGTGDVRVELKAKAFLKDGVLQASGGRSFDLKVESAQIQCYEVLADDLGAPVFIMDQGGAIYARDTAGGSWYRADKR